MALDLTKLILYSPDNALKNVNKYSGTIVMPTSLTANQISTTTVTFAMSDAPVFNELFCFYKDIVDAIYTTGSAQWYSSNNAGHASAGVHVNAPAGNVGYLSFFIVPTINGSNLSINAILINPYSNGVTLDPLSIPFNFIEYTLAN